MYNVYVDDEMAKRRMREKSMHEGREGREGEGVFDCYIQQRRRKTGTKRESKPKADATPLIAALSSTPWPFAAPDRGQHKAQSGQAARQRE